MMRVSSTLVGSSLPCSQRRNELSILVAGSGAAVASTISTSLAAVGTLEPSTWPLAAGEGEVAVPLVLAWPLTPFVTGFGAVDSDSSGTSGILAIQASRGSVATKTASLTADTSQTL